MPGVTDDDLPIEGFARLTVRQLRALRTTYPAWEIDHVVDELGRDRWTARLVRPITDVMRDAGVIETLERPTPESLASALAHQVTLIHNRRSFVWPDHPSPGSPARG
jgi:hypothetical protein